MPSLNLKKLLPKPPLKGAGRGGHRLTLAIVILLLTVQLKIFLCDSYERLD